MMTGLFATRRSHVFDLFRGKESRDQGQVVLGGKGFAIRPLTTLFLGFAARFTRGEESGTVGR